jgi:hypothetical protein
MTWTDALKLELVQTHLHKAKTIAQVCAALDLDDVMALQMDGNRPAPESPIEVIFKIWWEVIARVGSWVPWGTCHLTPQVSVVLEGASYRLDFQVECGGLGIQEIARHCGIAAPLIGVELDGHDFHERTRAQVTVRNKRDRDLQVAGWKVFHFSGSELVADPGNCVKDVWDYAIGVTQEFSVAALVALDQLPLADVQSTPIAAAGSPSGKGVRDDPAR